MVLIVAFKGGTGQGSWGKAGPGVTLAFFKYILFLRLGYLFSFIGKSMFSHVISPMF